MAYSIGVYQNKDSYFAKIIEETISHSGLNISPAQENANNTKDISIMFHAVECPALFPDTLDICILESGFKKSNSFPQANCVIVPDICNIATINQLCPKSVITYGLSCKNTVTVSSLIGNQMVISIQRELVTISGSRIEAQEFPVNLIDINAVEAVLAAVAILLILGVSTEKIKYICDKNQELHI